MNSLLGALGLKQGHDFCALAAFGHFERGLAITLAAKVHIRAAFD